MLFEALRAPPRPRRYSAVDTRSPVSNERMTAVATSERPPPGGDRNWWFTPVAQGRQQIVDVGVERRVEIAVECR